MKAAPYVKISLFIGLASLLVSCASLEMNNTNSKTAAAPSNDFMFSFPISSWFSTPKPNEKPLALAAND